jgi:vacuolar-type H+-ATPase subunit E/Vma4
MTLPAALQPVAAALLAAAAADTEQVRSDADHTAATALAQARQRADAVLAEARAQGLADAAAALATARARAHDEARALLLRARRETYERLRAAAISEGVAALHDDQYADLLAHLTSVVGAALGDGATVSQTPDGGVVGHADGKRADCSLSVFALRAADELAVELFDGDEPGAAR